MPVMDRSPDRSPAYALIAEYLPQFVARRGRRPNLAELQDYLEAEHQLRSSTTTVNRALRRWLASSEGQTLLAQVAGTHDTPPPASPAANPLLATFAQQLRREITAEVDARLREEARVAIEAAEATARAAAERADLAAQRAELLVRDADERRAREVAEAQAVSEALQRALAGAQEAFAEIVAIHKTQLDERHATITQREQALFEARELTARLSEQAAGATAALEREIAARRALEVHLGERERLATEQYHGLSVVLGQQLAAAREQLAERDRALQAVRGQIERAHQEAQSRQLDLLRSAIEQQQGHLDAQVAELHQMIGQRQTEMMQALAERQAELQRMLDGAQRVVLDKIEVVRADPRPRG